MMVVLLAMGCGGRESTGTWLERAGFGWVGANHRLSHWEQGTTDVGPYTAVVGGTSTTGIFEPLDEGCEPSSCDEFPIRDRAEVQVRWARTTTKEAVFGAGSGELVVGREPASTSITVPLPHEAKEGEATAVLQGFAFDTDQALTGGPACYRPKNGWLPKSLGLFIQDASLAADGMAVEVTVGGHFTAGPADEAARACLDAVIEQAQVALRVDVLAVVTTAPIATYGIEHELAYAYTGLPGNPGEQPDPDFEARRLGSSAALAGWGAFDFTFHEQGPSRGAYLRTLALDVSGAMDRAYGHATNYSPGTQLSAFDYVFTGTAVTVDLEAEVERGLFEASLEDVVDATGAPVLAR